MANNTLPSLAQSAEQLVEAVVVAGAAVVRLQPGHNPPQRDC